MLFCPNYLLFVARLAGSPAVDWLVIEGVIQSVSLCRYYSPMYIYMIYMYVVVDIPVMTHRWFGDAVRQIYVNVRKYVAIHAVRKWSVIYKYCGTNAREAARSSTQHGSK